MVRVRIAPSPTGFFHLGNARTALFNNLFAKKQKGIFVLRVEDTDKERSKKEYEAVMFESLRWLGIHYDEGPDVGGQYEPYRQSERTSIYKKYLEQLIEKKRVYHCFCTKEELDHERELQLLAKQPPRYSGKCKKLSDEECAAHIQEGKESVLRFAIDETQEKIEIIDMIRGKLDFDPRLIGDFVIAKDLNTSLYNFAVVVDDFLMKISHVIRGDDHISNTPKQILLCDALQFTYPQFAHLPMILNSDKTKLSKRKNEVSLLEYKSAGYLPEALVNFLALLGWNPGGDRELFTLEEMQGLFDMKDVHKGGAVFDTQKLQWLNGMYIRKKDIQTLTDACIPYLTEAGYIQEGSSAAEYIVSATGESLSRLTLEQIIRGEQERMKTLKEIVHLAHYFFQKELVCDADILTWKDMSQKDIYDALGYVYEVIMHIDESDFTAQFLEQSLKQMITEKKLSNGAVLWPLRVSLTGLQASQGPFEVASILGKEKTLQRILFAQKKCDITK